jgi:hypothetical protein
MSNVLLMNYNNYIENSKNIKEYKKAKKNKISESNFTIPECSEFIFILQNNYNLNQLKKIAKHYKIKLSGNKNELNNRIYSHLMTYYYSSIIQKNARKYIIQKYIKLNNHSIIKKKECLNDTDFLTMENLSDLPIYKFFTYFDRQDQKLYGFDIISIYNLFIKSKREKQDYVNNPYTNIKFPSELFIRINNFIKLSKMLGFSINLNSIDEENEHTIDEDDIEGRIKEIFNTIDSHGNYTCSSWFTELNNRQLVKFIKELQDIWCYRAQLTEETKRKVCPPHGNPFRSSYITHRPIQLLNINDTFLQKFTIEVIENMINHSIDRDSSALGCLYVLGALTLVSPDAANSLSWLYQSVIHI